ncbi:uncharacterized protein LOC109710794 [Ananas comosus]|uniref:Uncharacterized protein LOC109710794 n=1 Tax=Ananas comosus TaxID=4615 RepID=A0A6P5F077_ANACO|nr:uncharacterized protein LOC109710794 [Ananas comosus]
MEGLIPFLYRAIKRRRTRMYYKCLSYGAANRFDTTADYYHGQSHSFLRSPPSKLAGCCDDRQVHHRHRSLDDFSDGLFSSEKAVGRPPRFPKELRSRSLRMFACISGSIED